MKIRYLIILFVFFSSYIGKAQESLSETQKLAITAKVWGFLKYYHPNVANGDFNWDEEFLSILPKVQNANDKTELSLIYSNWIDSLGEIKKCNSCDSSKRIEYFENNFDLSWTLNEELFSAELSNKLRFIEENRFQGKQNYIDVNGRGVLEIKNEIKTQDFEYPSRNYKLLSLSRYWNIVEYFFPYKYLMDENWDDVLIEMIPKFINSKNASEYQLDMLKTVVKLDDTHADFYSNEIGAFFGKKIIPVQLKLIENRVIISDYTNDFLAKVNNLNIGDIIESVNGKDILDLIKINNKYLNGSNTIVKHRNLEFKFSSGSSDSVQLRIQRNGEYFDKTVGRYTWEQIISKNKRSGEKFRLLSNNIGYINMAYLEERDVKDMMEILRSTDGLIIDLRNYPTFLPHKLAQYFIKSKESYAKIIQPDISYPGKFLQTKPKTISPNKKGFYKNKVVILVNSETQSRAEYSSMLLQTGDNVVTVGNQTAGADGDITIIQFMGFGTYMTSIGVFYPDGTESQRVGVKIDIEVKPTIQGILLGKDEVLEKAIDYINNSK